MNRTVAVVLVSAGTVAFVAGAIVAIDTGRTQSSANVEPVNSSGYTAEDVDAIRQAIEANAAERRATAPPRRQGAGPRPPRRTGPARIPGTQSQAARTPGTQSQAAAYLPRVRGGLDSPAADVLPQMPDWIVPDRRMVGDRRIFTYEFPDGSRVILAFRAAETPGGGLVLDYVDVEN